MWHLLTHVSQWFQPCLQNQNNLVTLCTTPYNRSSILVNNSTQKGSHCCTSCMSIFYIYIQLISQEHYNFHYLKVINMRLVHWVREGKTITICQLPKKKIFHVRDFTIVWIVNIHFCIQFRREYGFLMRVFIKDDAISS